MVRDNYAMVVMVNAALNVSTDIKTNYCLIVIETNRMIMIICFVGEVCRRIS